MRLAPWGLGRGQAGSGARLRCWVSRAGVARQANQASAVAVARREQGKREEREREASREAECISMCREGASLER